MEYKLPEVWFQCVNKEVIGTGAYGTVYKVEDPDHNISAVKVLNIPSTDEEAQTIKNEMKDPKLVREYFTDLIGDFMREIQIMETLKDTTNVVHLKSHYLESNAVDEKWIIYIQMELLTSLTQYCSTHVMTEEEVIRLGIDILKAIRDCNKKDIIHRDIKPDNIMVTKDGTFKLGDFGIATMLWQRCLFLCGKDSPSNVNPKNHYDYPLRRAVFRDNKDTFSGIHAFLKIGLIQLFTIHIYTVSFDFNEISSDTDDTLDIVLFFIKSKNYDITPLIILI